MNLDAIGKSIITIHVKKPRGRGFSDVSGGRLYYPDTAEGIAQAKRHIESLVSGPGTPDQTWSTGLPKELVQKQQTADYRGHVFKLVRQKISYSNKDITNPDGSINSTSVLKRSAPVDVQDGEVNVGNMLNSIKEQATDHNEFYDKVKDFVNKKQKNHYNKINPNWRHLGFSGPAAMVQSRKPGETPEDFMARHGQKVKEVLGGIYTAAVRYRGAAPKSKKTPTKKPARKPTAVPAGSLGTTELAAMLEKGLNARVGRGRPKGSKNKVVKKRGRPTGTKAARMLEKSATSEGQTPEQKVVSKLNARALQRGTIKPNTIFKG
jgi:hypothetical protein